MNLQRSWMVLPIGLLMLACASGGTDNPSLEQRLTLDFGDGVSLHFEVSQFREERHEVGWCTYEGWRHVCTIDGRPYLGSDGEIPYTQLESLELHYGSNVARLDVSCMFNPWSEKANRDLYSVTKYGEDGYLVKGAFSDGAGGYMAEWLVIGTGSVRRYLRDPLEDDPCPE